MEEWEVIKKCSYCSKIFTMKDILCDPRVRPIGMAFAEGDTEDAYYFFQHDAPNCGTSLLINVEDFSALINESVPAQKLTLGECCEEHCVNIKDLSECKQECHFAPFRRFLLRLLRSKGSVQNLPVARS